MNSGILLQHIYRFSCTLNKTQCVSIAKTNRLVLFRDIIAVYLGNHIKTHYIRAKSKEFFNVKTGGTYSNYCTVKG
jgi:hypothetical protein